MKWRFAAGMAVIAMALALPACGSGDGETTNSTNEVKKTAYVKQANRLCAGITERYSGDVQDLVAERKEPETEITANRKLLMREVVLPILREVSSEFDTLGTPEGGWIGGVSLGEALDQAVIEFEDDPAAVTAGPDSPLREFSEIAEQIGAKNCSLP